MKVNGLKKFLITFITLNAVVFNVVFRKPKLKKEKETYDCAIVCGYPADSDGSPSKLMKTRVDKAVKLWEDRKVKYIILSGGAVANEYTEAEVMKQYALEMGVPESAIIEETQAVSTYHNMMYVKEIMERECFADCVVVTNGWHLRKANHYARKFKLDYVMAKAGNPEDETILTTLWRYVSVNLHMYYMMFRGYY